MSKQKYRLYFDNEIQVIGFPRCERPEPIEVQQDYMTMTELLKSGSRLITYNEADLQNKTLPAGQSKPITPTATPTETTGGDKNPPVPKEAKTE